MDAEGDEAKDEDEAAASVEDDPVCAMVGTFLFFVIFFCAGENKGWGKALLQDPYYELYCDSQSRVISRIPQVITVIMTTVLMAYLLQHALSSSNQGIAVQYNIG